MKVTASPLGVRIHGRGGQGVVTMAALLATVAFDEGYEAQAFPSFGSERMGAPVTAFCRISGTAIWVREPVGHPDAVAGDNCYGLCPDNAVIKTDEGHGYAIDLDYCKGCGICAAECPAGAVTMRPEEC